MRVGYGEVLKVSWVVDIDLVVENDDGSTVNITLKDVIYVPGFWCNLFS